MESIVDIQEPEENIEDQFDEEVEYDQDYEPCPDLSGEGNSFGTFQNLSW